MRYRTSEMKHVNDYELTSFEKSHLDKYNWVKLEWSVFFRNGLSSEEFTKAAIEAEVEKDQIMEIWEAYNK